MTMNSEYADRTELLAPVKALFRPVGCIVPDLEIIGLTMLFCEGFLQAKVSTTYTVRVPPFHCKTTCFSNVCSFTQISELSNLDFSDFCQIDITYDLQLCNFKNKFKYFTLVSNLGPR